MTSSNVRISAKQFTIYAVCALLTLFSFAMVSEKASWRAQTTDGAGVRVQETVVTPLILAVADNLSAQYNAATPIPSGSTRFPLSDVMRRVKPVVMLGPRRSNSTLLVPMDASEFVVPLQLALPDEFKNLDIVWPCKDPDWCSEFPLYNVSREACEAVVVLNANPCFNATTGGEAMCPCSRHAPVIVSHVYLHVGGVKEGHTTFAALAALPQVQRSEVPAGKINPTWEDRLVALGTANAAFHYLRCQGQTRAAPPFVALHASVLQELKSRTPAVDDKVIFDEGFFALDSTSHVSGHALEKILEGLGQYVHFGLRARNVSWIVPVVSATTEDHSNASTVRPRSLFEVFVRELTAALGIPVVEIPMKRTVLVRRFYTAYSTVFYNGYCWRAPALRILYPLAVAESAKSATYRSIAFLKLSGRYAATQTSPERAFLRSDAFERLLNAHNITVLDPTLPLLRRMRLVNEAELIVTTWGSTTTTTLLLLLDRRGDVARPLRIVVLVHPGYLLEARMIFWMRAKRFRSKKKRVVELRQNLSVKWGAFWDYDGGPRFCCRFVYVHELDQVKSGDLMNDCHERHSSTVSFA